MNETIGRIFDRKYRLTKLIGEGGMGSVYEAEHTLIERRVAVKVMHKEFADSEDVVNRFFREAQAASAIGHPNIVEIFDVGREEDGTAFIVMELLKGQSLSSCIKDEGRMAPERAVSIILQVLSALAVSHEKGIIHRDLKPDNVFLSIDNRGRHDVKLLDFGIAKMQTEAEGDQGLTKTGTVLGTPNYMSPESARGKDIDGRIDIWAAGVMLYEMLSGRLPFRGSSYNAVLSDILLETPKPIANILPDLPTGLVHVIEKAMEKDRDKRYLRVPDMISDLMPFAEDTYMSASAALALKNSLAPPPPPGTNTNTSYQSFASLNKTVKDETLDNLYNPSFSNSTKIEKKSSVIKTIITIFLIITMGIAGAAAYYKKQNQTIFESGISLAQKVLFFVEKSSWWPYRRASVNPPVITETAVSPEPELVDYVNAEYKQTDDPDLFLDMVTLKIENAPDNAKITVDGQPTTTTAHFEKSNLPMLLKVEASSNSVFVKSFIPDKDQTISVILKPVRSALSKSAKSRKGKPNKSGKSKR